MALKLMYITNNPNVAKIAEDAGVDRIFIDMEYIGKDIRQKGMDTVQSHHTIQDIERVKRIIKKSDMIVRINPIHMQTTEFCSSKDEIDAAINAGADILMLPYFKTSEEVKKFVDLVAKRVRTVLLLETPEAVERIDDILKIKGIDEIHIGLNDLSLGYHKKFMFELLADGTVERIGSKIKNYKIPFGFGGIASLGKGLLPSEYVIKEHYRLGSTCAILSRSFCNLNIDTDLKKIEHIFKNGLREIRELENECCQYKSEDIFFVRNKEKLVQKVKGICLTN